MMKAGPSRIRLFLVFWLFILSGVAFFDRSNITVAGVAMSKEFGIDRVHLGWLFSAFLIGYAGFQVPAGWLSVRFGPRKTLGLALVWWCVFSAATTLTSPAFGNVQLLLLRFVLGLGEALMYPSANQFFAYWIPKQERAKATGWLFAGVGVGSGFTPPLVTWLMLNYGWRASFWFAAVIGVMAALVWYATARDRPEHHPGVAADELAHIKAGAAPETEGGKSAPPWGAIFTSRSVWMLSLAYFAFGYIAYIFLSWFFIYLADAHGLDLKKSALYAVLPFISLTVCCLLGGVISDWLTRTRNPFTGRCLFPSVALLLCGLFLFMGSGTDDPLLATVILAGGVGALYLTQSSYFAVAADMAGGHTGILAGWINSFNQIAGAITASATPWLAGKYGWAAAFYVAAGFAVIGALAWLTVDPETVLAETGHPLNSLAETIVE
jgi:ACS family glucarate transporter-like MFS transporter